MAEFNKSLEVLLSWEGGYSNNPKDPGGETYCGISRRKWADWAGWTIVDQVKPLHWNQIIPDLEAGVGGFYLANFWNKEDFKDLSNQDITDKIFQHFVNIGNRAIKFAQGAAQVIGIDGVLGPNTVKSLNSYGLHDHDYFFTQYINRLVNYYEGLISDNPQLHVFEHEWMLRAKTIGKRP